MGINYLKVAWLMMRSKPVRSALSLLGIYIGVLALVMILAIREGVRRQLDDLYRTKGARLVFVHPGFDQVSRKIGALTLDDLNLLRSIPGIISVLPRMSIDMDARTPAASAHAHVIGIDETFVPLYRIEMRVGRNFLKDEMSGQQPVCLITTTLARHLFPAGPAVGQQIVLQGIPVEVIGVVDWTEASSQRSSAQEVDVLLPYPWTLTQDNVFISMVEVRLDPQIAIEQATTIVRQTLSHSDTNRANMYFIRSMEEMMKAGQKSNDRLMASLLGIAAISLLVGGIGVANVMVTSVTERTREVGIRKALGATRRDILLQFLVESAALSGCGGLLAVATGVLIVYGGPSFFDMPFPMSTAPLPTAACLIITLVIGLIAGVYPASHAASLSPSEALRYE